MVVVSPVVVEQVEVTRVVGVVELLVPNIHKRWRGHVSSIINLVPKLGHALTDTNVPCETSKALGLNTIEIFPLRRMINETSTSLTTKEC